MWQIVSYLGLAGVALCWVPQTVAVIKEGKCDLRLSLIVLSIIGSGFLGLAATFDGETPIVFAFVNAIVVVGSSINLFYKLRPRST